MGNILSIKLSRSRLDEYLEWSPNTNHCSHKLAKANAFLCNFCHYVN